MSVQNLILDFSRFPMVLRHGPQCICQLCTCGRHHCPYDRNASSIQFGNGDDGRFHRKADDYAAGGAAERARAVRPQAELSAQGLLGAGGQESGQMTSSYHEEFRGTQLPNAEELVERDENAEIAQHSARVAGRGRSGARPPTSDIWKRSGQFEHKSVSQADYGHVKGERYNVKRPQDSNVLKGEGEFTSESKTQADYTAKTGERYETKRPQSSELWKPSATTSNDPPPPTCCAATGSFQSESIHAADFTAKEGDRYETKRPKDSDVLKGKGAFAGQSSTAADYQAVQGERYEAHRPKDSDVLKGKGAFATESSTAADYTPKKGERYEAKRPHSSEIWHREGKMADSSVVRSDYTAKTGERYETRRPKDSDVLKGEGAFTTESQTAVDYPPIAQGERYDAQRPLPSEIWARGGRMEDASVTQGDFTAKHGERYETRRPKDSDVLKGEGAFAAQSSTAADYQHTKGERYEVRRPPTSDIWKSDGKMADASVLKSDFTAKEGERYDVKRPKDSNVLKGEGAFAVQSSTAIDYQPGERYERRVPQPTATDVIQPGGGGYAEIARERSDVSEGVRRRSLRNGAPTNVGHLEAVRFDLSRPEASDIWKTSAAAGGVTGKSVTQTDYAALREEELRGDAHHYGIVPRFEESTDLFKSDQPMESQTISQISYTHKQADRVQAAGGQNRSELVIGSEADRQAGGFETVSHHDFVAHSDVHRQPTVRPHGELQLSREGAPEYSAH
ncbi:hypothetical protein M3Y99_00868900 [Aphelenchoides fujianensis]|nr:hypothetical protein M3Y99_00868900 [Aphelenchoides fujianensis]